MRRRSFFYLMCCTYSSGIWAAPTTPPTAWGMLIQVILALTVVLLVIFAAAWVVKRTGAIKPMTSPVIKNLAVMSVGSKERLVLVQIGDKQILLGISPAGMNTIHVFDQPIVTTKQEANNDFSKRLMEMIKQRH
ncbi:flagellar biosynthetic protein FliO [Zooshikella marina]|uniref:flagellar biosynthetic protein FliO n=1 Tax=Zooshikella ganghwensis TaxID=202772 RepID=UPI001BAED010|nr:flagellar biosynthetic protein FliO [Zooshikella ganghwensis]MBU2706857.1 flagellar biosynthetic protein FliO [Zooshikella ganghwensis]